MEKKQTKQRVFSGVLLMIYLALITWVVLFKLSFSLNELSQTQTLNLIPYGASAIINGKIDMTELIYNVLFFVPFGLLLSMNFPRMSFIKKLSLVFLLSLSFEVCQYVLAIGGTDITDLINNTLGGLIGLVLYDILELIFRKKTRLNKGLNFLGIIAVILCVVFVGFVYFNK